jgi:hypothetical protein
VDGGDVVVGGEVVVGAVGGEVVVGTVVVGAVVVVDGSTGAGPPLGISGDVSIVGGWALPGTMLSELPDDSSGAERWNDGPQEGRPAGRASSPLLAVSVNVGLVLELGPATLNVAVPHRQRTAVPTAAGQVTRMPTETVAVPPPLGHRIEGLATDAELDDSHPAPPVPVPGIVMK